MEPVGRIGYPGAGRTASDRSAAPGGPILDPDEIVRTVGALRDRIADRFPGSGLERVCGDLLGIARRARDRSRAISRPILGLRVIIGALLMLFAVALAGALLVLPDPEGEITKIRFLEILEWTINDLIYIGLAILFLVTLEVRIKRRRALRAIHELRSVAHIIDMHQLTKDPDRVLHPGGDTAHSPPRTLGRHDLGRYLDYCSEMLSLVGKVAALYVQRFEDPVAIASVNEVEALATGLARKIWQKMMVLHHVVPSGARGPEVS